MGEPRGQQELVVLERSDALAEGLAVLGVLQRLDEDLLGVRHVGDRAPEPFLGELLHHVDEAAVELTNDVVVAEADRSDEHTSELQSLMRISYAVFCLNTKNDHTNTHEN